MQCLLIRDLLDSGIREALCSQCYAAVRQAKGCRPSGCLNAGRYGAGKALLSLVDPSTFPMPQCLHAALGQAKPSSPAAWRGQELRWSPYTVGPCIRARSPPSETGVGQMDGELAGVSAPHVLGPGQSPATTRARSAQLWWCWLLNLAAYSVLLFFVGFSFSSSPTGEISPINACVQEQGYHGCFGRTRSLYQEKARDGVC